MILCILLSCVAVVSCLPQGLDIQTGRRLYTGYQVIRAFPATPEQRNALLLINDDVDLWTDVGEESTQVDMMVDPVSLPAVRAFLAINNIHSQILIVDVQKNIEEESGIPSQLIENARDKRQYPEESSIFSLPFFSLPRDLFSPLIQLPQQTRLRRGPQSSTASRRPRNFGNSKNIPVPGQNAPVSSFPTDKEPPTEWNEICSFSGMNWNQYQSFKIIDSWMECLEENFAPKITLIEIGKSSEGRPLKVAKLSSNSSAEKPAIFVDGGIHAREWVSPAAVTFLLHRLVETTELDAVINKYDIYILPVANPDGYEYSRNHDRMWRKTRSKTGATNLLGQECHGVDPNRNFGWRWGGQGASDNPCKETFKGIHAFTEPETIAMKNFLTSGKNFQLYLTFHSYGQYILYPWGYDALDTPDWRDLHRVGSATAQVLKSRYGSTYEVGSAAKMLYPAAGGSDDWAKGGAGIKYSFTIELPDTGRHGFILPPRFIKPVGDQAVAAFQTMADSI